MYSYNIMNLERLVNSQTGKIVISVVLGLGLASLFHTVCNDDKCLSFNGPVISDVEDKIFKYGNKCYKYTVNADTCKSTNKIIEVSKKEEEDS